MIDYRQIFNDFSNLESLNTNENTYNVISLPLMSHKLGMSREGFPMFFVSTTDDDCGTNIIREILLVEYDVECTIKEYDGSSFGNKFSIITLRTLDKCLQSYFVDIFLMMLGKMVEIPSKHELSIEVERLVSIFSALNSAPRKKIQGLWAELLVIEQSKDPGLLINAWHSSTSSKYDFTMGRDKIEVKSTSSETRIHKFSLDQLNPSPNSRLLIASTIVRESGKCANGLSIKGLYDKITAKLSSIEAKLQLYKVIAETIGSDIVKLEDIYFDYITASDLLKFYDYQYIPRISKDSVPNDVTEVKFSSNLTSIEDIQDPNSDFDPDNSPLFKCLF
jgi:hypothetical protein